MWILASINHTQVEGHDGTGRTIWSEGGYRYVMDAHQRQVWRIHKYILIFQRYRIHDVIWMLKFVCHVALFFIVKPKTQLMMTRDSNVVLLLLFNSHIEYFVIRWITPIYDVHSES